jgi:hypothetical protein
MGDMKRKMTKDEALAYIADEMATVLDDDYPDAQNALVDDLMTEGFTEDEAEELVYDLGLTNNSVFGIIHATKREKGNDD